MHYTIATKDVIHEQIIEKSRFIVYIHRCANPEEAKEYLAGLRREHPKATHVVHAYYFGDRVAPQCGSSDDGEPKGTAGRPVLEAVLSRNARNLVVAVVRYFGGKKLGAGGLVRAYHGTALEALNRAGLVPDLKTRSFSVTLDYDKYENVKRICRKKNWQISEEKFEESVKLMLKLKDGEVPEFPYNFVHDVIDCGIPE